MGYTTDFTGSFELDKKLTDEQEDYLLRFADTRRMKRDSKTLMKLYKGLYGRPIIKPLTNEQNKMIEDLKKSGLDISVKEKEIKGTPEEIYGVDGEFFVGGKERDETIIDYNTTPLGQPSLWCQWTVVNGELTWDGGEKFYAYILWLEYMINNFFQPWGIKLNGEVEWLGEDPDDFGKIKVTNNKVKILEGKQVYE